MTFREGLKSAALVGLLALTSACGGGGDGGGGDGDPGGNNPPPVEDTKPDAFAFTAAGNLFMDVPVTSEAVEIKGMNAAADIGVTGGKYAINDHPFTDKPGKITAGDTVRVLANTSKVPDTAVKTVLDIGGVKGEFNVTTGPAVNFADIDPEPFVLVEPASVEKGKTVTSAPFTVTRINAPAPISITGGEYRIEDGPFTAEPGVVLPGQRVEVRATAPQDDGAVHVATLRIGNFAESLVLVTNPAEGLADTTPDTFAFPVISGVEPSAEITSEEIVVSGISAAAPVTVEGGEYSIGNGFKTEPGDVSDGVGVRARVQSSPVSGGMRAAKVTIGGVPAFFTVFTREIPFGSDSVPDLDSFRFEPVETLAAGAVFDSAWRVPTGFDAPAEVRIDGGEFQIDAGGYTREPQLMLPGQALRVRGTSPENIGDTHRVTVTVGTVSSDFEIHRVVPDPGNQPPTIDAELLQIDNLIRLDASASVDPDGDPILVLWEQLVDGGAPEELDIIVDETRADGAIAVAPFTVSGEYRFKATVSDGDLQRSQEFSIDVNFTPPNQPPLVVATVTQEDNQIRLDASASTDPDGDTVSVVWEQLVGGGAPEELDIIVDETRADGAIALAPFTTSGEYRFMATVSDGDLESSKEFSINVDFTPEDRPPVVVAEVSNNGNHILLDASQSSDPDGDEITVTWAQIVEGMPALEIVVVEGAGPTGSIATAAFTEPGTYRFTATVTAGALASSQDFAITVELAGENQPPVINATVDNGVTDENGVFHVPFEQSLVALNASGSSDPDGDDISIVWTKTEGDEVVFDETGLTPGSMNAAFSAPGLYVFRVTVSDGSVDVTEDISVVVDPTTDDGGTVNAVLTVTNGVHVGGNAYKVNIADSFTLNASGSSGDGTLAFAWIEDPANPVPAQDHGSFLPSRRTFSVSLPGTYRFSVEVTGESDVGTATVAVIVENLPPVADIEALTGTQFSLGDTAFFDSGASHDPDEVTPGALSFAWTLQEKPADSELTGVRRSTLSNSNFMPDVEGEYVVGLVVTDEFGATSAMETVVITVTEPLIAVITVETPAPTVGQPVQLSAENSTGPITGYFWRISSAPFAVPVIDPNDSANTSFIPLDAGIHEVSLEIFDESGDFHPATLEITVVD